MLVWLRVLKRFLMWQRPIDLDTWVNFMSSWIQRPVGDVQWILEYHEKRIISDFAAKKVRRPEREIFAF